MIYTKNISNILIQQKEYEMNLLEQESLQNYNLLYSHLKNNNNNLAL